jgi:HAD superfamily hydrolase (TIGR01509 family)
MQSKPSVIVFDLGNVLLKFDYQFSVKQLEQTEKGLGYRFLEFYNKNYNYHRAFERGDLPEKDFLNIMLSAINWKIDKKTFCKYYSDIFSENKEVVDLLPKLKKNFILVLLSNTNIIHYEYGWKQYDWLAYFDKIVVSYEAGAVKPEEKIYRAVESYTMKNAAEHFFIDDIAEYVNAARSFGWDGVQFTGYKNLFIDLINRGVLNYRD